ncbi:PhoH family protein [Nevskia soli]|uniref:PhoH family protein n=1 Tax=Nevskia soli TaxID=418856 RepID=UPI0004A709B6|nr:PhoH family protein [Nevskia soli]
MSTTAPQHIRLDLVLEPDDGARLANLSGPFDAHLRAIELGLGVEIRNRGNRFRLVGPRDEIERAEDVLRDLFALAENGVVTPETVHLSLVEHGSEQVAAEAGAGDAAEGDISVRTKRGVVRGRGVMQKSYLRNIATHDLSFGIGPAGTGKTYLAVASAVQALERDRVRRLVLVRPAVEAGEKLGFLPGDMAQKIDPYLRPLYDALYEMLGFDRVARLAERSVIEVAPLAFMRGRTLNESFIILDEAQNTTVEQMKMFLTRIGFGSVAVVTGDVTQIDLPKNMTSGLKHAMQVLDGVPSISFTHFRNEDVVRHPLVQAIVRAYDAHEGRNKDAG